MPQNYQVKEIFPESVEGDKKPNLVTSISLERDATQDMAKFLEIKKDYEKHYGNLKGTDDRRRVNKNLVKDILGSFLGTHFDNFGLELRTEKNFKGETHPYFILREDGTIDAYFERAQITNDLVAVCVSGYKPEIILRPINPSNLEITTRLEGRIPIIEDFLKIQYALMDGRAPTIKEGNMGYDSGMALTVAPVTEVKRFLDDAKLIFEVLGEKRFEKLNEMKDHIASSIRELPKLRQTLKKEYISQLIKALKVDFSL